MKAKKTSFQSFLDFTLHLFHGSKALPSSAREWSRVVDLRSTGDSDQSGLKVQEMPSWKRCFVASCFVEVLGNNLKQNVVVWMLFVFNPQRKDECLIKCAFDTGRPPQLLQRKVGLIRTCKSTRIQHSSLGFSGKLTCKLAVLQIVDLFSMTCWLKTKTFAVDAHVRGRSWSTWQVMMTMTDDRHFMWPALALQQFLKHWMNCQSACFKKSDPRPQLGILLKPKWPQGSHVSRMPNRPLLRHTRVVF